MTRPGTRVAVAVAGIVIVGAWLRFRGLAFGLPAVYNMDEAAIMSRTLALAVTGPNPHNFLYPSFYFYALFVWLGGFFLISRLTGAVASLRAFEDSFFVDPSAIYIAGRVFTALLGTATLVALFAYARRIAGTTAGVAACAFLAVAPFAVQDSHYVKHDIPVTLLVTLSQLAMVSAVLPAVGRHANRSLAAAAALAGLACSTHYYAVFLALPLLVAAVATTGRTPGWMARGSLTRVLVATGVMAAAFVVASPFLVVSWETALRDVTANRAIVIDRAAATGGWLAGVATYGDMLLSDAAGWPVAALAVVGAIVLVRAASRVALLVLAFPVAFFAFIGGTVVATRYLNPLLPTVALLAGIGAVALVSGRMWKAAVGPSATDPIGLEAGLTPARHAAVVLLVAVAAIPGLLGSWRVGSFFATPDTRTLAQDFIERTLPAGETVLLQPYSVALRPSQEGLREALTDHLGDVSRASPRFARQLALTPYPEPSFRLLWLGDGGLDVDKVYLTPRELADGGVELLARHDVRLVVLKRFNGDDPVLAPLLTHLRREAERIATFSPVRNDLPATQKDDVRPFLHNTDAIVDRRLERPGPVVDVWRLRDTP